MLIYTSFCLIVSTLEYPINGGGGVRINGGRWKWLDIIIIGGWNNRGMGILGNIENSRFPSEHVSLYIYVSLGG